MSAYENLIRESKLETSLIAQLHQAHQEANQSLYSGPSGWHGYDDIQTLVGLQGSFLWAEDPFNPANITFTFFPDRIGEQGTYVLARGGITVEAGNFTSIPNNPAIGWAVINLLPQGGTPRPFMVAGMMTDENWRISIMILNKLGQTGPLQPPFSAIRLPSFSES